MFVVLDTNHFTELVDGSAPTNRLKARLDAVNAAAFTTIVTYQEVSQGWCALINRKPAGRDQVFHYAQNQHSMAMLNELTVLPFDDEAATHFHHLQDQRIRVGTMDLKIASICIAQSATLLTRNLIDFDKIPGLRVENWLD